MAIQKTMLASIEAVRELPLPDDCKQLVAKFLRHPTADLVHKVKFWDDADSTLSIFGDDLPRRHWGIRKMFFRHNYWSGEPVDCHGNLRLHEDGRIHCYPDGQLSTWGCRPHPDQLNMPPRRRTRLELESSDDE